MKRAAFKAAFPFTLPVLTGYLFLGIAFGVLLASKDYSFLWAFLMSITIYAGSMQFAAIDVLTTAFNLLGAAVLTFAVNARHLFYGLSMLDKFRGLGLRKRYMIFALTDETYSLLCAVKPPPGVDTGWFWFFIALLDHLYWITGCVTGALAGSLLRFNSKGIDFVMTALFVVIFIEQWEKTKEHLPALTGLGISIIALALFGERDFLLVAMPLILATLTLLRNRLERLEKGDRVNDNTTSS